MLPSGRTSTGEVPTLEAPLRVLVVFLGWEPHDFSSGLDVDNKLVCPNGKIIVS